MTNCLLAEVHDGVDNIRVVLLKTVDGLVSGNVGLLHNKLDVGVLKAGGISLGLVLGILVLGQRSSLEVSGDGSGILGGKLSANLTGGSSLGDGAGLGSSLLGLGSGDLGSSGGGLHVLVLGLTEDNVGVAGGGPVDLGVGDHEDVLSGSLEDNSGDTLNLLEVELGDEGSGGLLLLLDDDGGVLLDLGDLVLGNFLNLVLGRHCVSERISELWCSHGKQAI